MEMHKIIGYIGIGLFSIGLWGLGLLVTLLALSPILVTLGLV